MSSNIEGLPMAPQKPKPSNLSKEEIENIAEKVARDMQYAPETNLPTLLENYGGRVSIKDFWKLDGANDESIIVQPNSEFEIFIPPHTSAERDRFTIAHELGHYVLHYLLAAEKKHANAMFSASRYGSNRVEWEANWFAAGFLMPKRSFKKLYKENGGHIGRVANHFNVSTAAAYVRAKALGLHRDGTDTI